MNRIPPTIERARERQRERRRDAERERERHDITDMDPSSISVTVRPQTPLSDQSVSEIKLPAILTQKNSPTKCTNRTDRLQTVQRN